MTHALPAGDRMGKTLTPTTMKRWIITLFVATLVPAAASQTALDLMQEAAYQERALGNLDRANEIYRTIAEQHATTDRALAAQSLYQLAVNQEAMGREAEARQVFRRLVSEFPDQQKFVAEARNRGVGGAPGEDVTHRVIWDMIDTSGLTDGEPSPDGRFVSFAAWQSGNLGIKDLETGEITLLTDEGTWDVPSAFADNSSWSRDGSDIAFVWWDGDDAYLKVVDVASRVVRTLVQEYVLPWGWTSDGRVLGMWGDSNGRVRLVYVSSVDGSMEIVYEAPQGQGVRADLSPDERWIVLNTMRQSHTPRDMYLLAAEGGEPIPLAVHPADDRRAFWQPDGGAVVFESNRSGTEALWRVRVEDGRQVGEPELIFGDMRHGITRGFDETGRLFVEKSESESAGNLYTLALKGAPPSTSSEPVRMPLLGTGYNAGASFSSDGRYMSYVSQRPFSVLVVRDLTTGREIEHRDLSTLRMLVHRVDKPRWRPGTYQLMVATNRGPRVIDAITGEVEAVVMMVDFDIFRPAWSAEGDAIWGVMNDMVGYISFEEGDSLSVADGSEPEVTGWRVLPDNQYCEGTAVHPSDGTVAYWCDYRAIYRLDPTTGEVTEWWRVPDGEPIIAHHKQGAFIYTPNGSNLLFQRWQDGGSEVQVWRLPVGGSEPVPVTDWISRGWGFEMHPSGEQAVYTVLDGARNEMWVLEGLE